MRRNERLEELDARNGGPALDVVLTKSVGPREFLITTSRTGRALPPDVVDGNLGFGSASDTAHMRGTTRVAVLANQVVTGRLKRCADIGGREAALLAGGPSRACPTGLRLTAHSMDGRLRCHSRHNESESSRRLARRVRGVRPGLVRRCRERAARSTDSRPPERPHPPCRWFATVRSALHTALVPEWCVHTRVLCMCRGTRAGPWLCLCSLQHVGNLRTRLGPS
jgi:hypothetical protein